MKTNKTLRNRKRGRLLASVSVLVMVIGQIMTIPVAAQTPADCATANVTPITAGNIDCATIYRDDSQWDPFGSNFCATNTSVGSTIVIDPGHSGTNTNPNRTVNSYGLHDIDYPNPNENEEMFYAALKIKAALVSAGYNVILTKGDDISTDVKSVTDSKVEEGAKINMGLEARANVANGANAALAVSLHDDHGQQWGSFAQIYTQKVNLYRTGTKGKVTFASVVGKDADKVAAASQKAGEAMNTARNAAEGRSGNHLTDANFAGRNLDDGNIPQVMLYSKVPWIYNEVGAAPAGKYLSQDHLDAYVKGVVEGIKAAVTQTTVGSSTGSGDASLNGFKLPVTSGPTGAEEAINDAGQVGSTGSKVSFPQFAKLTGKNGPYRDYYINMRWTFASWSWDGHSKIVDSKQLQWIGQAPRKVLVTNPKSGKSIIAVIMESGPAPWVGSSWSRAGHSPGDPPSYWQGYQSSTPSEYDGIVSGFPPKARDALGLSSGDLGYEGKGVKLNYAWAPDQSAEPGPTSDSASGSSGCTSSSGSPNCQNAQGVAKIICEAKKYDNASYQESAAGNHMAGGSEAWKKTCKFDSSGNATPSCLLDCSGLVSVAVYDAFGYDKKPPWVTSTIVTDNANWKEIPVGSLQPGDVIEPNPGHVEIVDHVSGDTIYTFGAHTDRYPQPKQVGPATYGKGDVWKAFQYVGQGTK